MEATNSVKGSLKLRGGISLSKTKKHKKSKKSKKRKKDKEEHTEEPSSSSSGASAKVTSEDGDDRDAKKQRLTDTIVVEDTRTAAEKAMDERRRIQVRLVVMFALSLASCTHSSTLFSFFVCLLCLIDIH